MSLGPPDDKTDNCDKPGGGEEVTGYSMYWLLHTSNQTIQFDPEMQSNQAFQLIKQIILGQTMLFV